MSLIKVIEFFNLGDERSSLVALENDKNIPFDIKRVYYIYGAKSHVSRGYHAHKKLKQVAIAVSGSCRFILDNGKNRVEVVLNDPSKGLLIESFVWREMHDFTEDCVLIVLASDLYNEDDYIRDYQQFLEETKKC
ncbi:sugar 3,4-ketoisomerase [Aeromonas enteropelogenes]|uniref:sugar 3,4-ketoisomerase n=1 Tax=Aeromonas enteropelogenes TaxID=29489 RepID=UPI003F78FDE8